MHAAGQRSAEQSRPRVRFRGIVVTGIAALLVPLAAVHDPEPGGAVAARPRGTDFNGDGYDDLVIADAVFDAGAFSAGAVWVVPGSATGPRPANVSGWSQSRAGMAGNPEAFDRFGASWTAGDFNADGYHDLGVCIPGERVAGVAGAGAVSVILGSPTGLRATGSKLLSRATAGVPGSPSQFENWCNEGLATGDFNRDGRDDLAVASPYADVGAVDEAGSITVLLSSASGPSGVGAAEISQASPGVPGSPEDGGWLSRVGLRVGDFNGDGYDDLTVSASEMTTDGLPGAGGIYVLRGSQSGLRTNTTQLITRAMPGVPGDPQGSDRFGFGVPAVADWNRDGFDDLVVGDHTADAGGVEESGQIVLLRGSTSGLVAAGGKTIHQDSPGVPGIGEESDQFGGTALSAGDFNGDGRPDVAAGAYLEDVGVGIDAGAFFTFPGTANSIGTTGAKLFTQDTAGVPGAPANVAHFSDGQLWTGDFNGDGYDDLVVPCRWCDIGALYQAGYVMVFRGSPTGTTVGGLRQIKRSSLPGQTDAADGEFGGAF